MREVVFSALNDLDDGKIRKRIAGLTGTLKSRLPKELFPIFDKLKTEEDRLLDLYLKEAFLLGLSAGTQLPDFHIEI